MYELYGRNKRRKFLYSNASIALLIILVALASRGVWHIFLTEHEASSARVASQAELDALLSRKKFLTSEVTKLKTESGVEQEIRERFSVVKPGENVAIIVDSTTTIEAEPAEKTFLNRSREWFENLF